MIRRRALLAASTLVPLSGCAGGVPTPPTVVLSITASADVNADDRGTPLPIAVRVYTLSSRGRFASADAFGLLDRESAVLGSEGKRVEALIVRPGESRTLTMILTPDVRYVGVAALYQNIDGAQWRSVAPVAPSGVTKLVLLLGRRRATLEVA